MSAISVIIPTYNAENTILETIKSIQKQTFSDWEIIVINDGSTDKTLEKLSEIKDQRVKVLSYENSGVAISRNRGISHATGEYLAFIDADDLWTPDKLALQLAALEKNPEAGVAYSWTYYLYDEPNSEKTLFPGESIHFSGDVYPHLLVKNFLANGSNPLIRRNVIDSVGEFDSACVPCEDWDFYLRLAAHCFFVVVPKHQIIYRQSANSGSSQTKKLEKANLLTIDKAYQTAPPELQYLKNETTAFFYQYCTQQHLKNKTNNFEVVSQAGKSLGQAIRLYPPILLESYTQDLIRWLLQRWILAFLAPWLKSDLKNLRLKEAISDSIFYRIFKQSFLLTLKTLTILLFIPSKIFTKISGFRKTTAN